MFSDGGKVVGMSGAGAGAGGSSPMVSHSTFTPGSIMRIELKHFMTHQHTVLVPSSGVNFILGANGSGKSSIVCAMCLGLGGTPSNMERGGDLKAFVMNGKDQATIKILLKGRHYDSGDWEITRTIVGREGRGSNRWSINGAERTNEEAQSFLRGALSINMDNFCMFLPQERVGNFSRMSPDELLLSTMHAANRELVDLHASVVRMEKNAGTEEKDLSRVSLELAEQEKRAASLSSSSEAVKNYQGLQTRQDLLNIRLPYATWRTKEAAKGAKEQELKEYASRQEELFQQTVGPKKAVQERENELKDALDEKDKAAQNAHGHQQAVESLATQLAGLERAISERHEGLKALEKGKAEKEAKIADKQRELEKAQGKLKAETDKVGERAALDKLEKDTRAQQHEADRSYRMASQKTRGLEERAKTLHEQREMCERQLRELESYVDSRVRVSSDSGHGEHCAAQLLPFYSLCFVFAPPLTSFSPPSFRLFLFPLCPSSVGARRRPHHSEQESLDQLRPHREGQGGGALQGHGAGPSRRPYQH